MTLFWVQNIQYLKLLWHVNHYLKQVRQSLLCWKVSHPDPFTVFKRPSGIFHKLLSLKWLNALHIELVSFVRYCKVLTGKARNVYESSAFVKTPQNRCPEAYCPTTVLPWTWKYQVKPSPSRAKALAKANQNSTGNDLGKIWQTYLHITIIITYTYYAI